MINDDFLSKNQHPCMPVIQANILFQDLQVPVWAPIQNNSKFQVLKRFKAHELGSPRIEQMLINWPDTPWSLQINVEKVSFGQVKMDVFFLLVFFQNLDSSLWFHPSNKKSDSIVPGIVGGVSSEKNPQGLWITCVATPLFMGIEGYPLECSPPGNKALH